MSQLTWRRRNARTATHGCDGAECQRRSALSDSKQCASTGAVYATPASRVRRAMGESAVSAICVRAARASGGVDRARVTAPSLSVDCRCRRRSAPSSPLCCHTRGLQRVSPSLTVYAFQQSLRSSASEWSPVTHHAAAAAALHSVCQQSPPALICSSHLPLPS